MGDNVLIRPYQPGDRRAVRQICQETADRGHPLPAGAADPELVADLVTRFYTDIDSRWSWVAEAEGVVVGYVLAASDTHAFRRAMAWRITPHAILHAIARGFLWSPVFRHLLRAFFRQRGRKMVPGFDVPADYPAHLHINLAAGQRGRGTGERLINASLTQLGAARMPGVHAAVRADNPNGCRFFERMDFTVLDQYTVIMPCAGGVQNVTVRVYGRRLGGAVSSAVRRG